MIVHVGKSIFRFINKGRFYEVFEKTQNGDWDFIGFARDTNVLNLFVESVRKEDVNHSP